MKTILSSSRILGTVGLVGGHVVNVAFDEHLPIAEQLEIVGDDWLWARVWMFGHMIRVTNGAQKNGELANG